MLPALSYHFHLSPADVWAMNVGTFARYSKALDQIEKEGRHHGR